MKKNRKNFLFFVISFFVLLSCTEEKTKRENYENFLKEECRSFSHQKKNKVSPYKLESGVAEASVQNYFMTLDPNLKRVPTERLADAYKEVKKSYSRKSSNEILPLEWTETQSNMAGRVRTIMFDPNVENKVWTAGVTGGIFYSEDFFSDTSYWVSISDKWENLSISCMTYDPNNTQNFYAGTGEAQTAVIIYRESSGRGSGIYKTNDGGTNWEIIESTRDFHYVTDIVVKNENGNSVIYAGVVSGIYKDVIHQSSPSDGLFRSEDDGLTWTQVLPNIPGTENPYAVSDIEVGIDGRIYVGTSGNLNAEGGANILYSDDGTEGTWNVFADYKNIIESDDIYNVPGRVMLSASESNENVIYAVVGAGSNTELMSGFNTFIGRYFLRSDDKGETWTEKTTPIIENDDKDWAYLSWHAMTIKVHPENENIVFIGGLDLWRTDNAGENWNHISLWTGLYYETTLEQYVHADQHFIAFNPNSNEDVLFATDGGVFYSNNAVNEIVTFESKNNNLNTLQFYTCDIYPIDTSDLYMGGLQDNGTLIFDQEEPITNLSKISGGDGAYCFFDKSGDELLITSLYYNQYYYLIFNVAFLGAGIESGLFINPVDYDYKSNTLYANATSAQGELNNQLLKISNITTNANQVAISEFIELDTDVEVAFSCVKYSEFSPDNDATLFLGTQAGQLFKVAEANTNPQVLEITGVDFPTANISSISVGGSEDTLLVTFSNYGVTSVFASFNGGSSWTSKESNLPDMPVRWSLFSKENSKQVLLATEIGVWETFDITAEEVIWEISGNIPNVRVDMMRIRDGDNKVIVATHGRGTFTTNLRSNIDVSNEKIIADKNINVRIYPNPTKNKIFVEIEENSGVISIFDLQGKKVFEKNINKSKSVFSLEELKRGIFNIKIKTKENTYNKKLIKN